MRNLLCLLVINSPLFAADGEKTVTFSANPVEISGTVKPFVIKISGKQVFSTKEEIKAVRFNAQKLVEPGFASKTFSVITNADTITFAASTTQNKGIVIPIFKLPVLKSVAWAGDKVTFGTSPEVTEIEIEKTKVPVKNGTGTFTTLLKDWVSKDQHVVLNTGANTPSRSYRLTFLVKKVAPPAAPPEVAVKGKKAPKPKNVFSSEVGLSSTAMFITQPQIASSQLTPRVHASAKLGNPTFLPLQNLVMRASAEFDTIVLYSTSDISLRAFTAWGTIDYTFPKNLGEEWQINMGLGFGYATSLSSPTDFGFRNLFSIMFDGEIGYTIDKEQSIRAYFSMAPLLIQGLGASASNAWWKFGVGYHVLNWFIPNEVQIFLEATNFQFSTNRGDSTFPALSLGAKVKL